MKNIIKAQLYQLKSQRFLYIAFFGVLALSLVMTYMIGIGSVPPEIEPTASFMASSAISVIWLLVSFFTAIFTGYVCASDFGDKTMNYETMSGTLRKQSFFARVIITIPFSVLFSIALIAADVLIITALYGWGGYIPAKVFVFRLFIAAFPIMRMSCFLVLVSYIFKNVAAPLIVQYLVYILISLISAFSAGGSPFLFAITNILYIGNFELWATFGLETSSNYIFETYISSGDVIKTIAVSLIVSAAYIIVGYSFYHRDDLS